MSPAEPPEFTVEEMVREKLFCATLAMTALRMRLRSPDRQIRIPTFIPHLMRTMWTPRTRDNQKLRNTATARVKLCWCMVVVDRTQIAERTICLMEDVLAGKAGCEELISENMPAQSQTQCGTMVPER